MKVLQLEEYKITSSQNIDIQALLQTCFEGYPSGRSYFKQIPHFRFLAYIDQKLVGHLAVDHRVVSLDRTPFKIFGIVDICVHPQYRSKGIASQLIEQVETLAQKHQMDFIILMSDENPFYTKIGYQSFNNTCKWLIINDHQTLGVHQRSLHHSILVKSIGEKKWQAGLLDFLGTIF